ncbi:unnamed protein product [Scytosiphon promiscuus]
MECEVGGGRDAGEAWGDSKRAADSWMEDWNAEFGAGNNGGNSMGKMVRDLRRQERTDLRNRFLSIDMDSEFVSGLVAAYRRSGCAYPVFANLRNGLWYGKDWDGTCYFKSTDGHSGRWAFSYTRLNMHLATAAAASGGCIVVDSTRAGKRFPDSLTATVPIWCCLLNRLAAPENDVGRDASNSSPSGEDDDHDGESPLPKLKSGSVWDTALHTPRWLSKSEADQIEERMSGWIAGLGNAREVLSKRLRSCLKKPLRAVWLSPESHLVEGMMPACSPDELSFTPVICVSASKVITPEHHREQHSWVYLQGAGDDEEHWSCGITPEQFWENSEKLVDLAKGGDQGSFERETAAMISRSKRKPHARSPDAGNTGGRSAEGVPSGTTSRQSNPDGGGRRMLEVPFQPGGPELHAVLGATGLAVGSLAYAASNWASQGANCSLLNLSDQAFPEDLVEALRSPSRQYLHISLKEGKKANPPRYWKTKVFPTALAFIASAIGGARPGAGDPPQSTKNAGSGGEGGGTDVRQRGPCMSAGACREAAGFPAQYGTQTIPEAAKSPARKPATPSQMAGETAEDTGFAGTHDVVRSSAEEPQSSTEAATKSRSAMLPKPGLPSQQQKHDQGANTSLVDTAGTPAGRCLVVCPTGAEASVAVCLCALVAFFPPPPPPTPDPRSTSTSPASGNLQPPSNLSSSRPRAPAEADGQGDEPWLGGGGFSVLRRGVGAGATTGVVTKAHLRWRFLLIQQECPWARPPRRLMQELNEYFMTPGEHSWWTLSDQLVGEEGDCHSSV